MSIFTDIRAELIADATLNPIISDRVYWRNPQQVPSDSYITMHRTGKDRTIATEQNFIRFIVYSQSMADIETITNRIVEFFEEKTYYNGKNYYATPLINQNDSDTKLDTGFYFAILTFEFNQTTPI